ncbi:hypothetical protein D3C80_1650490 [compost metagenome]
MKCGAKIMPANTAPIDSSSSGTIMTSGLSCGFSGPWWPCASSPSSGSEWVSSWACEA